MKTELPYTITILDRRDKVCKVKAHFLSLHDAKDAYKYFSERLAPHQMLSLWDDEDEACIRVTEID